MPFGSLFESCSENFKLKIKFKKQNFIFKIVFNFRSENPKFIKIGSQSTELLYIAFTNNYCFKEGLSWLFQK